VLCQLVKNAHCKKSQAESIETCCQLLRQTQLLDPSPAILREYSKSSVAKSSVANSSVANSSVANSSVANSSVATRLGERGENSAALVKSILSDDTTAAAYTSWLKELTPAELDEIGILQGAVGDSLFAVRKKGESFPAPILSDGTLRFAAIAAAFFQPEPPHTLMIEEIENGLHPTRLRLAGTSQIAISARQASGDGDFTLAASAGLAHKRRLQHHISLQEGRGHRSLDD